MPKKTKSQLTIKEVCDLISGTWEYSCEVLGGGLSFPLEIISLDDSDRILQVNSHGGVATFYMQYDGTSPAILSIKGQREWRKVLNSSGETIATKPIVNPKTWDSISGAYYRDRHLMYQYRIDDFDVNGISDVQIKEYSADFTEAIMEGWFYYVPSQDMLQYYENEKKSILTNIEGRNLESVIGKSYNTDWLKLFGKITLIKKTGGES